MQRLTQIWIVLIGMMLLSSCSDKVATVSVSLKHIDSDTIVIQDVAIFDARTLRNKPNMDVVIKANRIISIGPHGTATLPTNAHFIDGNDATLLPGLIDMHGHVALATQPSWKFALPDPKGNLAAYAYAGITTVFDPSDISDDAYTRRDDVARGKIIGPRILTTGRMLSSPHGHPRSIAQELAPWWLRWYLVDKTGTAIHDKEDAINTVNTRADAGANAIKIAVDSIPLDGEQLSTELIEIIVQQADQRGLPTVAHIGTTDDAIRAAEAGVAMWVHGVYKERIPDEKIAQLISYGIPMITTSEVFDRYGRAMDGPIEPTKLELETVATSVLDSFYPIPDDFEIGNLQSWAELMSQTQQVRLDNVRRLHQAGMTIFAGSDVQSGVFPGASLHRELVTLVAAGMTPSEAIHAATLAPARYLAGGDEPNIGLVEEGKYADLLMVRGDPTQDINALADIREVFLNGQLLQRNPVVNP